MNKSRNVKWLETKLIIDRDVGVWCVDFDTWDEFIDKNDWFLSLNGTYCRKSGGLRSSEIKHDDV